ncbi:SCP2 sterol-binding domain-containing protein [Streptomyces sp. URMC 123]|uniref:SCP2 sterol-binding domain-containing protein n=1 Tax=Streptomyces sp. URMC 123 TaxID=3423403 RepID=UPI003F1E26EC
MAQDIEATFLDSLGRLARKLQACDSVRQGGLVFRLTDPGAGAYRLECGAAELRITDVSGAGVDSEPLVEVIGRGETLCAILDGEADARQRFLAGGLRVRGDLSYLNDVAVELGLLSKPLFAGPR